LNLCVFYLHSPKLWSSLLQQNEIMLVLRQGLYWNATVNELKQRLLRISEGPVQAEEDMKLRSVIKHLKKKEKIEKISQIFKRFNLFSEERLSELSAFVMGDEYVNRITLHALEIIHSHAHFLQQLLDTKSKRVQSLIMKQDINLTILSHVQRRSADLCRSLSYALKNDGINVWLDMQSGRRDEIGVIEGIFTSSSFTIVMTTEYFYRACTVFETLVATIFKKKILILMETDLRFGGFTDNELSSYLPNIWSSLLNYEVMTVRRRGLFWNATVTQLKERLLGIAKGPVHTEEEMKLEGSKALTIQEEDHKSKEALLKEELGKKALEEVVIALEEFNMSWKQPDEFVPNQTITTSPALREQQEAHKNDVGRKADVNVTDLKKELSIAKKDRDKFKWDLTIVSEERDELKRKLASEKQRWE